MKMKPREDFTYEEYADLEALAYEENWRERKVEELLNEE